MLQPAFPQGEPVPAPLAVSDAVGRGPHQGTFFAGLFARLSPKISGKGAAWAVAHRIAKVVWLMLHKGVEYKEHGTAVANPRTLKRKLSKLLREFHRADIGAKSLLEQSMIAAV